MSGRGYRPGISVTGQMTGSWAVKASHPGSEALIDSGCDGDRGTVERKDHIAQV